MKWALLYKFAVTVRSKFARLTSARVPALRWQYSTLTIRVMTTTVQCQIKHLGCLDG